MEETNKFRTEFKYYKRKCPPPDMSRVLDFSNPRKDQAVKKIRPVPLEELNKLTTEELFIASLMKSPSDWDVYDLQDKPGLIFIRNPFSALGQRYWICRCLRDYTQKPSRLNIDAHNILDKSQTWWNACHSNSKSETFKRNLRWATLGYHHNWDTKVYSEDMKDPFPADLAALSRFVSRAVGGQDDFHAEAAIVNFYHFDSTLSGHTDHSEKDLSAPLLSFSFGQSAIFLLGGKTMDVAPTAIFITSGDIVIMSKHSRQCYHGIPKILSASESPWDIQYNMEDGQNPVGSSAGKEIDTPEQVELALNSREKTDKLFNGLLACDKTLLLNTLDDQFWEPFKKYITNSRINMNVRQVLCKGDISLQNKGC